MKMFPAISWNLPTMSAASFIAAAVMFMFSLVMFPQTAQACCSALVCPHCISSSRDCVCGDRQPVCNSFACNCNAQCGMYTLDTNGRCYFSHRCDDASARAGAQARLNEIDANRDSKISRDEGLAWLQKQKTPWMTRIHAEGLPASLRNADEKEVFRFEFDQMDTNKDGYVQPGELDESLAAPAKKNS